MMRFETKGRSRFCTSDARDRQNSEILIMQEIMTERVCHRHYKSEREERSVHAYRATGVECRREKGWERGVQSVHPWVHPHGLAPLIGKAWYQVETPPACSLLSHQSLARSP